MGQAVGSGTGRGGVGRAGWEWDRQKGSGTGRRGVGQERSRMGRKRVGYAGWEKDA